MDDWKEKYEDLFARIKAMADVQPPVTKAAIESHFPELKESEDERTWLINYLSNRILNSSIIAEKENLKKAIAWLEKQGEQILANSAKTCKDEQSSAWSEEDENILEEIKRCVGIQYPLGNPCIFKFLKSIKGRYTWKPSKEQMKANELMIGDWVMVNDIEHTHPLQVAEIFKKSGAYYATLYWDGMPDNVNPETLTADVNKVLPIPLTPEILEKNGFVVLSRYFHGNPLQYCVLVDGLWIDISGENYFEGKLEYVHQLQHALKLCEIEKEIEL